MSVALWIISILSAITVLERLKVVSAKLGMPLFSVQTFRDMFQRNHDFDGTTNGTMTSRLNEPPTSLSKLTKNVNDYLDKPSNTKKESSSTSTTTSTTKPETTTTSTTRPEPAKAQYLDKTDPNETGRNVAQIVFGQEEEEDEIYKKFLESSSKADTSSTSTDQNAKSNTTSSNTDQNKNKKPSEKSASSDNPTESK